MQHLSTRREIEESATLDVKETAKKMKVCTDTIYTMVKEGEIPYFKMRSRIFFYEEEIDNFFLQQSKNSIGGREERLSRPQYIKGQLPTKGW